MRSIAIVLTLTGLAPQSLAAVDCAQEAATDVTLNLSTGVYTERAQVSAPLKLRLPTGTNPHAYGECLKIKDQDPSRRMVQTITNLQDCHRTASSLHLITASPHHATRIGSKVDAAKYAECLKYDIKVDVLLPSAVAD
jgi:hypothetical protein